MGNPMGSHTFSEISKVIRMRGTLNSLLSANQNTLMWRKTSSGHESGLTRRRLDFVSDPHQACIPDGSLGDSAREANPGLCSHDLHVDYIIYVAGIGNICHFRRTLSSSLLNFLLSVSIWLAHLAGEPRRTTFCGGWKLEEEKQTLPLLRKVRNVPKWPGVWLKPSQLSQTHTLIQQSKHRWEAAFSKKLENS